MPAALAGKTGKEVLPMWRELPTETRDWSEEDWERFFREQDDRHFAEMQAHMCQQGEEIEGSLPASVADELLADFGEDDLFEEDFEFDEELGEALERIPAWRAAAEFCDRTIGLVAPMLERRRGGPRAYLAQTLVTECYLVPDYILAGHELGYNEDTLCGNIALCVRSRRSLERCIECLERFGGALNEQCRKLMICAIITRVFLDQRITELREKVWWQ